MSDTVIVALAVSVGPTLAGIANLIVSIRNNMAIKEVHLATNSMKDELVQVTKTEAHAAGVKEQKERDLK